MKKGVAFIFLSILMVAITVKTQAQQQKDTITFHQHNNQTSLTHPQNKPGEYIAKDSSFTAKYTLAQRDKTFPVVVFPGNIQQDSVTIANYTISDDSWEGKIVKKFAFILPNGTKAAEAVIIGISKDNCSIQTYRDNKVHNVEVNTIGNIDRVEILAKFLVANGYL